MTKGAQRIMTYIAAGMLVSAGIGLYTWHESVRPPVFELYIWNTPGAPSLFVRTKDDTRILINGGANSEIVKRLTEVLPFYSRRIDQVISTSDDAKYGTGVIEVLNRYRVAATSTIREAGSEADEILSADGASLTLVDAKKQAMLFEGAGERVLIVPFNVNSITKKLIASSTPNYIVYSAQPGGGGSNSKVLRLAVAKQKPDILAGVPMENRFNIRAGAKGGDATGGGAGAGVKLTIENGHLSVTQLAP